ncbi:MAG: radical SAM protein [Candidatus Helarchaeota archaeon]
MREIHEKFGTSLFLGKLPTGCQYCHKGSKIVIFITGLCTRPPYCSWYCPISIERRGKDAGYVNEVPIQTPKNIIEEAKTIDAEGASITGGEPLLKITRVLKYIKLLKEVFGKQFHIHLYTNGELLSKDSILALKEAGLDEIRFHPATQSLHKIKYCVEQNFETGIEIPAIPFQFQKILSFIKYLERVGGDFINLNEFEITESNAKLLKKFGFQLKENTIAAVKNSDEFALKILSYAKSYHINVHYCSIGYKDSVQLKKRYLRRARNIIKTHETISEEGLLLKGIILKNNSNLQNLSELRSFLIQKFNLSPQKIVLNMEKNRLEVSIEYLRRMASFLKQNDFTAGIIEELPLNGKNRIQMTFTPI